MPAETSMDVDDLTIRPLAPDTWPAFAELVTQHNGVFGGCWCTWFHTLSRDKDRTYESNRDLKCRLVEEGRAHAALVLDGDQAVAWAQYGPPEELPNIHHRQEYEAGLGRPPDYRITCVFVDRRYRRRGIASSSFLYNGTRRMYEEAGFTYERSKGQKNCVMTRAITSG